MLVQKRMVLIFAASATLIIWQGFAPPAPIRCLDDPDMGEFCKTFKGKEFCKTKVEMMEIACSKTCDFCPQDNFSKDIDDIIKDQKKLEKVTGDDAESIKQDLKEGKGLPTAQGEFEGKGKSEAEKEATEVPENEGRNDKTEKGNSGKEKCNGESKEGNSEKGNNKQGGEDLSEGKETKDIGATSGCDKKCQTECVQAHNKYRANHGAPPLKWDRTLADQAQAVADTNAASNKFEHSDWAAGKGGECIAWGPIKPSWLIAVKDWHDEEKNYDWTTGKSKNGKAIGHFTQVVWKKATKIGCGVSEMTMYGSKGPFYIAQMDVVGIVQNKKELDLVGRPKEDDMNWFKDLRDKQMNSGGKRNRARRAQFLQKVRR